MIRALIPLAAVIFLAAAPKCAPSVFAPAGHYAPAHLTGGPGLVLSGGGLSGMPYRSIFPWMREHFAAPSGARAGNLVILQASPGNVYTSLFYKASRFASIREIAIPPCASRAAVDSIAPYVDRADVVLFAGGDQSHYTAWKGSKLIEAVRAVYARGGIVGGGSAGLAIQGQVVFDSAAADRILPDDRDVATPDAVANPYEPAISFTMNLFNWPPLAGAIADTHFARRDRFGRLAAFMARTQAYGVAVDEGAALLVDSHGIATLVERSREQDGYVPKGAYILQMVRAAQIVSDKPLIATVKVTRLQEPGARYDLLTKHGSGTRYTVRVNGTRPRHPYSRNPYD